MLRRTTLAMALVAGSLLAGLAAAPAHAAEDDRAVAKSFQIGRPLGGFVITLPTPEARCERSGGGGLFSTPYDYSFRGVAYYSNVPGNPGFRQWTLFRYRLDGAALNPGPSSNVTLRLLEGGTTKLVVESGDNVNAGVWHEVRPSSPVYTRTGSAETITFDVIFDRPRRGDPRCTAITGRA
jgi:hypothetical protein